MTGSYFCILHGQAFLTAELVVLHHGFQIANSVERGRGRYGRWDSSCRKMCCQDISTEDEKASWELLYCVEILDFDIAMKLWYPQNPKICPYWIWTPCGASFPTCWFMHSWSDLPAKKKPLGTLGSKNISEGPDIEMNSHSPNNLWFPP